MLIDDLLELRECGKWNRCESLLLALSSRLAGREDSLSRLEGRLGGFALLLELVLEALEDVRSRAKALDT